jgi:hypothetical protein
VARWAAFEHGEMRRGNGEGEGMIDHTARGLCSRWDWKRSTQGRVRSGNTTSHKGFAAQAEGCGIRRESRAARINNVRRWSVPPGLRGDPLYPMG